MLDLSRIRLAAADDAIAIAAMSRDCIEHGLGWRWTPARVLASIREPSTNVAVVHERGRLLAFGIMQYGEASAHLALLGVDPARRRRGLGSALIAWLEKCAIVAGIATIRVEARSDQPYLVPFYLGQGYRRIAPIAGYYRGAVDAVRFEKALRRGGDAR